MTDDSSWAAIDAPTSAPTRPRHAATAQPVRLRRSHRMVVGSLDEGGRFLQRHAREVLVGSAVILVPLVALNLWATTAAFDSGGNSSLAVFGADAVATGLEETAAFLVIVFSSLVAAIIGVFTATLYISHTFGRPTTVAAALRSTGRRLPRVFVAWALGHVWLPLASVWTVSDRPGDVAARLVVVAPLAAVFAAYTLFVVPVIVAENASAIGALKRSARLTRRRFGPAFGFVATSSILGWLVLAGLAWLPALAEQTGFITFGGLAWLAQGLTTQLGVIIVVPLIALSTSRFYLEVRMDAEGLDLALDADDAFGPRRATPLR